MTDLTVKEMDDNIKAIVGHAMKELPRDKQAWLQKKLDDYLWQHKPPVDRGDEHG